MRRKEEEGKRTTGTLGLPRGLSTARRLRIEVERKRGSWARQGRGKAVQGPTP